MNFSDLIQQYHGTTLPKLIEKQIKSLKKDVLAEAIQGTYEKFSDEFRPQVDAYTIDYIKNWFGPHIVTIDLGELFNIAVTDIERMTTQAGVVLNEEEVFDVFNIMVMRLSYFAHSNPELRKMLGIKKGWLS